MLPVLSPFFPSFEIEVSHGVAALKHRGVPFAAIQFRIKKWIKAMLFEDISKWDMNFGSAKAVIRNDSENCFVVHSCFLQSFYDFSDSSVDSAVGVFGAFVERIIQMGVFIYAEKTSDNTFTVGFNPFNDVRLDKIVNIIPIVGFVRLNNPKQPSEANFVQWLILAVIYQLQNGTWVVKMLKERGTLPVNILSYNQPARGVEAAVAVHVPATFVMSMSAEPSIAGKIGRTRMNSADKWDVGRSGGAGKDSQSGPETASVRNILAEIRELA